MPGQARFAQGHTTNDGKRLEADQKKDNAGVVGLFKLAYKGAILETFRIGCREWAEESGALDMI